MTFDASRCQPPKNTQRRLCFIVIFVPRLLFSCNFRLLCPFLSATLPRSPPTPAPFSLFLSSPFRLRCTHAGWSTQFVVLFNMHGPFLLLYYCPTGGEGPFLWPDNGRRRDREHGGHVPFATPCYLSILPPFSPDPLSPFQ